MFKLNKKIKDDCKGLKVYKNIRLLPLLNYLLIMEHDDIRYLLILDNYNELPNISEKCKKKLQKIYSDIIFEMPADTINNDIFIQLLELEKKKFEFYIASDTEKKILKTIYNIELKKLEQLLKKHNKQKSIDISQEIVNIEMILNIYIDREKTSLYTYFQYRKQALLKIKELKKREK